MKRSTLEAIIKQPKIVILPSDLRLVGATEKTGTGDGGCIIE
jgi:hypothetical protein